MSVVAIYIAGIALAAVQLVPALELHEGVVVHGRPAAAVRVPANPIRRALRSIMRA